jgi:Zn finger protein HypA/HybF involved in hydrogenase expression
MMRTEGIIDCAFCGEDILLVHKEINVVVCPKCNNVSKVMDGVSLKYTDYDLRGKLRLEKTINSLKLRLGDGQSLTISGILELEYNESSMYFFFTPSLEVFAFLEYTWYTLKAYTGSLERINLNLVESGEYYTILPDKLSYVINKESKNALAFAGQCKIPMSKKPFTVLEHNVDKQLYFSFFDLELHLFTYEMIEIEGVSLSQDIIHYPLKYSCQQCKREIEIEAFPFTKSFACVCGHAYAIDNFGEVQYIKKFSKDNHIYLPLQSKADFEGISYTVLGHVRKEDSNGYDWDEFTLWNQTHGFIYLSTYNGHWIKLKIEKLKHQIPTNRKQLSERITEGNENYTIFNDYTSSITHCRGFFAGNILNDQEYVGIEYIAPPSMWAFEKPRNESVTAFKGHHLSRNDLIRSFGDTELNLPPSEGVGAVEPYATGISQGVIIANCILAFMLLLFAQLASTLFTTDKVLYKGEALLIDSVSSRIVTPPLKLLKEYSNLSIKLYADVSNSWLENEIEVINLDNGTSFTTEQGVEYYSGVDGGESWSEGDRENELILSALPKGNYQLSFTPTYDSYNKPYHYTITILNDVNMYKNFGLLLLILGIPSVIYAFYNHTKEVSRWSNSIYNPYISE